MENKEGVSGLYGMSAATIEMKRGHAICIKFKKEIESVSGYLWNIDPSSGTVFVFETNEKEYNVMYVIMSDSIYSITFLNDKEPLSTDLMDAYMNLEDEVE
ncbi:hypothetical protein T552_01347 [Pneumocystis carinii B80]|uniref:Uncharacterized protein n=1 Tax=Pneumocystis carinii (strain B80) TaxID=1408658 RepID=A0A0W4ZM05_PNEC8|nr:hypothetical protein T552_01347 [Pneumocystis carinii B80]KTW29394.1 hypothetical protein T552_01347 [Pneumocystis carinii B80]